MTKFVIGQRWVSETELDQGLGTVLKVESRRLTLLYTSTGDTRIYQSTNCPLHRIIFNAGDIIRSHDGCGLKVLESTETEGLITYKVVYTSDGSCRELCETEIDGNITLTKPRQRILAGQLSKNSEFNLRYQCLKAFQEIRKSPLLGLAGNRISLIPHQLNIAKEVGDRFAPRVLLADEVGLGKTIEAGMIMSRQLLTGRIQRILVVVPETLTHQWLVEMIRRFNLRFTLLNSQLYNAIDIDNPFDSAQLILTSIELLSSNVSHQNKVLESDWDLLVVDEAHHLQWSEKNGGSSEYKLIERLVQQTPSVLLLTATPEQLGREGHFARLRLLDPKCFNSLDKFYEQEGNYRSIADLANTLLSSNTLKKSDFQQLETLFGKTHSNTLKTLETRIDASCSEERKTLLGALLDRYGISRVLFRNTRETKGFPGRVVQCYPLETPELYKIALDHDDYVASCRNATKRDMRALTPERIYQSFIAEKIKDADVWWRFDPRIVWLSNFLKLIREKVLVICSTAETAIEIESCLRIMTGQHASVFHEKMNIIERDRAAAWFADKEYGAQLLICSEIGSEGRNFQFAHHLIMFDLPVNPDLLEQRIGRLDRIGQTEVIKIHVPCLIDTPQERLFDWFNNGIEAFSQSCPSASKVFAKQQDELKAWVLDNEGNGQAIINQANSLTKMYNDELKSGRNVLLELSSSCSHRHEGLKEKIQAEDDCSTIKKLLVSLLDVYGVDIDEHSEHALILQPGNHMRVDSFPGIPTDGATVTFDRNMALSREDMLFVTREHPVVREGLELLLSSDIGNTAVAQLKNRSIPEGTTLLEAIFIVEASSHKSLHLDVFMPPAVIHTLLDPSMNNLSGKVNITGLHAQLKKVKKNQAIGLIKAQTPFISKMMQKAEDYAKASLKTLVAEALQNFTQETSNEARRLLTLKAINPNIREDEINALMEQMKSGKRALEQLSLRLDAVRMIVTTH